MLLFLLKITSDRLQWGWCIKMTGQTVKVHSMTHFDSQASRVLQQRMSVFQIKQGLSRRVIPSSCMTADCTTEHSLMLIYHSHSKDEISAGLFICGNQMSSNTEDWKERGGFERSFGGFDQWCLHWNILTSTLSQHIEKKIMKHNQSKSEDISLA